MKVTRILGIDPGSRLTGFGVVDVVGNQIRHVTHGTLRLSATGGRQEISLENRLLLIHHGLTEVIEQYRPSVMAIERVFFAKNATSALKLGQARGAAILSGAIHGLEIHEYSPSEVKASVVGHGQADKQQVAKMLNLLLGATREFATSDASDGLALAVCHAYVVANQGTGNGSARNSVARAIAQAQSEGRPSAASAGKNPTGASATRRKKRMSIAESLGYQSPISPRRRS